jgi:type II secretory pathway component PulF
MVYPTLLVCVMIATFYFVLTYIMPKIHDIFNQLGAELPGITQGMIVLSALAANPIGTGLAILAVLVLIASLVHRPFHDALYRLMGNMPGYRNLIALSDTAISMKFLERTLSRGVPLPTALSVGALAMQLAESRAALTRMSAAAEQGHEVGPLLSLSTPAVAAWLFRQAEARGDLPATCDGIASYCEDRFDRLSRRTVATLEPVLILLVGVGIALMLLSVYMPLFNIPKIIGVDS